jgi:hypothetical protein
MSDTLARDDEIGTYDYPGPTPQEELAAIDEEARFDFMNLPSSMTGIAGVIFISTDRGALGPRVKFFERTGKGQPSFSVSSGPEPRVPVSSLPERVVRRVAPPFRAPQPARAASPLVRRRRPHGG